MKSFFKIITTIIVLILTLMLFANFTQILNNKNLPNILGYSYINLENSNMEPDYYLNDLILMKLDYQKLRSNDVIVYKNNDKYIIKRVLNIEENILTLKDNTESPINYINSDEIIGKAIGRIPYLGFLPILTNKPYGLLGFAIFAIILAFLKHQKK